MGVAKKYGEGSLLTADSFLRKENTRKWVQARKANKDQDEEETATRKNLQFAKDLFISWDNDNDGKINESDIIRPLISLGLAPDSSFAKKICQALDTKGTTRSKNETMQVSLDDFVKIFKNDKISDILM